MDYLVADSNYCQLGTRKVPPKISAGIQLTAGSLLCLGVRKDGPQKLSATDANGACAVFRVRCLDDERIV